MNLMKMVVMYLVVLLVAPALADVNLVGSNDELSYGHWLPKKYTSPLTNKMELFLVYDFYKTMN